MRRSELDLHICRRVSFTAQAQAELRDMARRVPRSGGSGGWRAAAGEQRAQKRWRRRLRKRKVRAQLVIDPVVASQRRRLMRMRMPQIGRFGRKHRRHGQALQDSIRRIAHEARMHPQQVVGGLYAAAAEQGFEQRDRSENNRRRPGSHPARRKAARKVDRDERRGDVRRRIARDSTNALEHKRSRIQA